MDNVVRFPPRYLHPVRSVLGREVLRLIRSSIGVRNVADLARHTGANPAIIDELLDRAVTHQEGTA